jgi:hypothetical protein
LSADDVAYVRGKADAVIAVNDAHRLAPWATAIMASDAKWWKYHQGVPSFMGLKYSLQQDAAQWGATVLEHTGPDGIELAPTGLRSGRNSGAAAINVAVHFGAVKVVLLGYDMGHAPGSPSHWFGDHPSQIRASSPYDSFIAAFRVAAVQLQQLGVSVLNCSRITAVDAFPRVALEDALRA